jgi:hypothetical protein
MTDEQIIEKLGLTDVDDASREVLVGQVRSVTEMRLIGVVSELLSDEQLDEFKKLQDDGDNDAVWKWLDETLTVSVDELRQAVMTDYLVERAARA